MERSLPLMASWSSWFKRLYRRHKRSAKNSRPTSPSSSITTSTSLPSSTWLGMVIHYLPPTTSRLYSWILMVVQFNPGTTHPCLNSSYPPFLLGTIFGSRKMRANPDEDLSEEEGSTITRKNHPERHSALKRIRMLLYRCTPRNH